MMVCGQCGETFFGSHICRGVKLHWGSTEPVSNECTWND